MPSKGLLDFVRLIDLEPVEGTKLEPNTKRSQHHQL